MYVSPSFKSKAALKRALAEGKSVGVFAPALGNIPVNGTVSLEGPNYKPHTWYGEGTMRDGKLVKVA